MLNTFLLRLKLAWTTTFFVFFLRSILENKERMRWLSFHSKAIHDFHGKNSLLIVVIIEAVTN